MKVPSFDLKAQNWKLREELTAAIEEVVLSGQFILGDVVSRFEKELADFCDVEHGIGVGNGSDALYIALEACGVGPGDEVITTPFTFFATAGSIVRAGAVPVFADIDPVTFNIDPVEVEKKITPKTKAILPVHLYGQPADMDLLMVIARSHGLKVIEDAAQAIGATYTGRKVCALGDVACISFFPTKNLGAFGDAGMIVTNTDEIADKSRMLRVHGSRKKYRHEILGINSRLDALQAKVLSLKLKYLDEWTENRRRIAERYTAGLSQTEAVKSGKLRVPKEMTGCKHVYHQYTILTENRDDLKTYLAEREIASTVYYPVPLHLQKVFSGLGYKAGDFPRSEEAAKTVLSLPMFPEMTNEQVDYVVETIAEFEGFTR
jgi:dTDP-4-amino-4,6-dideoxygalactose transaminase